MSRRRRLSNPPAFAIPMDEANHESFTGTVIAKEGLKEPGPVLRQLAHEVQAWAAAPAAKRRILGEIPDLSYLPHGFGRDIRRTFALLREEPGEHTAEAISIGLIVVAEWAETEEQAIRTALVFHQAALLVLPSNVPIAYHIGRLLRRLAMYDEAEAWLTYAAEQARGAGDGYHQALALSGLGNLKRERGNFPEAVPLHQKALDVARRHGVSRLEGDALYDLAVMCFERCELADGMTYAREAMSAYGPGHDQIVRMANDLAWIWMHLHGEADLALRIFQQIEPCVQDPPFRALLLANIARAAAEVGAEHIYESAWLEAFAYIRKQDVEDGHAAAFCQMALASVAVEQLERARHAANCCLQIAGRRREHRSVFMAEQILSSIHDGVPGPDGMKTLFPSFSASSSPESAESLDSAEDFAAQLVMSVRARRDGAPESPVHALIRGR
ncbi:MAG TPA: tetratricopeptide repeat protein [Longimicrobiaceae bacterium]